MITTVVMFTVVAINHNCHKLNLNCQITMYHLTSMIVDQLLTIFGAKLYQYQNCDAVDAVLRELNLVNRELFGGLPQIDQKKFIRHNFLQVLISV
mgnify:CR=1 FL=1